MTLPFLGWSNAGTVPSAGLLASGWTPGAVPSAQTLNYVFWLMDQWAQQLSASSVSIAAQYPMAFGIRLIKGGTWGWAASSGALSWSSSFALAIPSVADSANTVAAGSCTLTTGQLAYVNANLPTTTAGSLSNGSFLLSGLSVTAGIAAGQGITGTGIPGSTTVASVTGNVVTMSAAATLSGAVTATFCATTALTAQTATIATFVPTATTIVFAERRETSPQPTIQLGVNAAVMHLYDGEQKEMFGTGFDDVSFVTAGQTLTALTPVYCATAADAGRTAGSVYPIDASAANGLVRGTFAGFVSSSAASAATVPLVSAGIVSGFSSLTPGAVYYADPTTIGGITATRPTVTNQYLVVLGIAVNATTIALQGAGTPSVQILPQNTWPNYSAGTEAQLVTALASATSGGGGVIVLTNSFSLSNVYFIPPSTILVGRRGGSVITFGNSSQIALLTGAELRDINFVTSVADGQLVIMQGNYGVIRSCTFQTPASGTNTCVTVYGSDNHLYNCVFQGVLGSPTATAIAYSGGSNNTDDASVFLP